MFFIDKTKKNSLSHLYCLAYFNTPSLLDDFTENLEYALPIAFYYDHHDLPVQESITNDIKQFYFDNDLTRERDIDVTNVKQFEIDCELQLGIISNDFIDSLVIRRWMVLDGNGFLFALEACT